MDYRNSFQEIDNSLFTQGNAGVGGGMVVKSLKGPLTPVYCEGKDDVIAHFGLPSSDYPDVFEALAFCQTSPCWIVSAVGQESLYGGVDVKQTSVEGFGEGAGRISPDSFDYESVNTYNSHTPVGTIDGLNAQFTGTIPNVPVDEGSLVVYVNDEKIVLDDVDEVISGAGIATEGTNTIDYATGAYDFTLFGTAGTYATVRSTVDLTADVDLSGLNTYGTQSILNSGSLEAFTGATVPAIATQSDYELDITIDSSINKLATISINVADDWDDIALAIQTALRAATSSTETVVVSGGDIIVTSVTNGSTSNVLVAAGTAGTGSGDLLAVIDAIGATYAVSLDTAVVGTDVDYYINVTIDATEYADINLGHSDATTRASIISAINVAVGSVVAVAYDVGGEFIDITGVIADSAQGIAKVENPTTGTSGLVLCFASSALTDLGTTPTGVIPKYGETIVVGWVYNTDISSLVSHSIFTVSPYADSLAVKVSHTTGSQFEAILYSVSDSTYTLMTTYDYSLIRETDNFGKSLYYEDVFLDDKYIEVKVNSLYPGGTYAITSTVVDFSGGYRGEAPTDSSYTTAWAFFEKKNKYPAKIFMDVTGNSATTINTLCATYQQFSHGITCVPIGTSASNAVTYREDLGINNDNVSLYTNWCKIKDPYNDSAAWISHVGSVGKKYAAMSDVYNAGSPAGIDENGHGGLISDWRVLDIEYDYSDTNLQNLDEAQINPIIRDAVDGLKIYGDKTLQSYLSDTSYVGTRRLYNYILETIKTQILKKQEFRKNDAPHRLSAKILTEDFLAPIITDNWLEDAFVQCDENNNDGTIRNQRKFVVDVYVKAVANSQFVLLKLTRVGQNQVIAELIA